MNTTHPSPPAATFPPAPGSGSRSESVSTLARFQEPRNARGRWDIRAPLWLQVLLIVALLGCSIYVGIDRHYLWSALLAIGGLAFAASFLLRRLVGDEYDRA